MDSLALPKDVEEIDAEIVELTRQNNEMKKMIEEADKNALKQIKRDARNFRRHREGELNLLLKTANTTGTLIDKVLDVDKRLKALEEK